MIDMTALLQPELILTDLKAGPREGVIRLLVRRLYEVRPGSFGEISVDEAVGALLAREELQSTGVGNGLAFPHARIPGWHEFAMAVGISRKGIDFHGADGKPARWICLMISSDREPYIILQTMAAFSRYIHTHPPAAEGLPGPSPQQMILDFRKLNIRTSNAITARDIMRPVKVSVKLSTPVEQVAHIMHLNHTDDLPVVDGDNRFFGVIGCSDIFAYGIPDFFRQLHTVSFVRHIDPFEKYFKIRKTLTVGDLITKDLSSAISGDDTLLEIVFQLTVKNKPRLFILNEGMLAGEIDRFSIVDKILFF